MRIFIGADHRGQKFKKKIMALLDKHGCDVVDLGATREDVPSDYPKIAKKVGQKVVATKDSRGVLLCMTGIGHSIAANKIAGVRAALCYNARAAKLSREHNNANILVLGAKFVNPKEVEKILKVWLNTSFSGGRHLRRINQIKKIEGKA